MMLIPTMKPIPALEVSPIQFLSMAYFTKYPIPKTRVKIPIMVSAFCFKKSKTGVSQSFCGSGSSKLVAIIVGFSTPVF